MGSGDPNSGLPNLILWFLDPVIPLIEMSLFPLFKKERAWWQITSKEENFKTHPHVHDSLGYPAP